MLKNLASKFTLRNYLTAVGIITLLFILGTALVANAFSIVPSSCQQGSCTPCEFFKMISNIFNFMIAGATLFALFGVILGAIFYMSGSQNGVTTAKGIWKNVAIGLGFLVGAWLIVNTVLQIVAKPEYSNSWYTFECRNIPISAGGTSFGTGGGSDGYGSRSFSTSADGCFGSTGYYGYSCGSPYEVTDGICPEYNAWINTYSKAAGLDPTFVKAIMTFENKTYLQNSSPQCERAANWIEKSTVNYATGLLQVSPHITTNDLSGDCKMAISAKVGTAAYNTERDAIAKKLQNPEFNIKCGTQAMKKMYDHPWVAGKYYNLAAAWNGGYKALQPSAVCTAAACKKWQCKYDLVDGKRVEQTKRTSFLQTREYVEGVMKEYEKLCPRKSTPKNTNCGQLDCNVTSSCGDKHQLKPVNTNNIVKNAGVRCASNRDDSYLMHQDSKAAFNAFAAEVKKTLGKKIYVISMFRTDEYQACIYESYKKQGKTGYAGAPNNGGNHQSGLAFDLGMGHKRDSCPFYLWKKYPGGKKAIRLDSNLNHGDAIEKDEWLMFLIIAQRHGFQTLASKFAPATFSVGSEDYKVYEKDMKHKAAVDKYLSSHTLKSGHFCGHEAWHFNHVSNKLFSVRNAKERTIKACPNYGKNTSK